MKYFVTERRIVEMFVDFSPLLSNKTKQPYKMKRKKSYYTSVASRDDEKFDHRLHSVQCNFRVLCDRTTCT